MQPQKNFNHVNVRTSAILTNSYVASDVLGVDLDVPYRVQEYNQMVLLVDFTIGSLTSASIKVETSPDNSAWYQESFGSISAGTDTITLGVHTIAATGKYRIPIAIKDRYIRVSVIGTGTVTNSLMAIDIVTGNV